MTERRRIAEPMTTEELADTLNRLAAAIREGDSLEGSFEYLLPGPDDKHHGDGMYGGCPHVMVTAAFRVGNRQGQGSMQFIGEWTTETTTPEGAS